MNESTFFYSSNERNYISHRFKQASNERKQASRERKYIFHRLKQASNERKQASSERKYILNHFRQASNERKQASSERKYIFIILGKRQTNVNIFLLVSKRRSKKTPIIKNCCLAFGSPGLYGTHDQSHPRSHRNRLLPSLLSRLALSSHPHAGDEREWKCLSLHLPVAPCFFSRDPRVDLRLMTVTVIAERRGSGLAAQRQSPR